MTPETRKTLTNGLWHNNPALVQILGLCPLLATSTDTVNAIGLGLATIFVLTLSNTLVAATRRWLRPEIRIPVFVLLIAGGQSGRRASRFSPTSYRPPTAPGTLALIRSPPCR